eukprot:2570704-Rhodomonas_salina.1
MQETPPTCPLIQCNDWKLEEEVTEPAAEQAGAPAQQHPFGTIETHSNSDDEYFLELHNVAVQLEAERRKAEKQRRQCEARLYGCDGTDSDSPDQLDSDDLERHRGRHYPTTRELAYIVSAA